MINAVTANFLGDNLQCWMQIQVGKGPWSSEVSGIVKIGQTMTMVMGIKVSGTLETGGGHAGCIQSRSRLTTVLCATFLELQTKDLKDFTIKEKAPSRTFSWLKVPSITFTFRKLSIVSRHSKGFVIVKYSRRFV